MNIIIRCKCAQNLLEIDRVEVTKNGIEITVEECDSCAINHAAQQSVHPTGYPRGENCTCRPTVESYNRCPVHGTASG
jgi:hypothetical protein